MSNDVRDALDVVRSVLSETDYADELRREHGDGLGNYAYTSEICSAYLLSVVITRGRLLSLTIFSDSGRRITPILGGRAVLVRHVADYRDQIREDIGDAVRNLGCCSE